MGNNSEILLEQVFTGFLRQKGLKLTQERINILNTINGFHGHFNADELYDVLKEQGEKISRATVYRTIPLFKKCGIIRETIRSGGKTNYETSFGNTHHDHLLCMKCGNVIEFKVDEIERLQEELCRQYQFTPVDHWLSIRGYCKDCRSQ